MLKLSEMNGRAVVDLEMAEKLGEIDETIVDPESRRVAGFIVSRGPSLLGAGQKMAFAGEAVHSIGPDALTVRGATLEHAEGAFPGLPRRRDIVGRKIVGHSGKMYGHIHDVLVDPHNGQLIGYTVDDSPLRGLDGLFGSPKSAEVQYVRADADLRVGSELVIVPDEAIVRSQAGTEPLPAEGIAGVDGWRDDHSRPVGQPSVWVDQRIQPQVATPPAVETAAATPAGVEPAVEPSYEELAFGTAPLGRLPHEGEPHSA